METMMSAQYIMTESEDTIRKVSLLQICQLLTDSTATNEQPSFAASPIETSPTPCTSTKFNTSGSKLRDITCCKQHIEPQIK